MDKLVEFCQGTDRGYWEKKVVAEDVYGNAEDRTDDGSEQRIKKILYGISSYEYYEHKENYEAAIRSRMEIFAENKERVQVTIYRYPDDDMKSLSVEDFDAYYGSSMPIVQEFVARKKPVMLADYSI